MDAEAVSGPLEVPPAPTSRRRSCLLALAALGTIYLVDLHTPGYISLTAFYALPPMIVAWGVGLPAAVVFILGSTCCYIYVSIVITGPYPNFTSLLWNIVSSVCGFFVPCIIVYKLKVKYLIEQDLRFKLELSQARIRQSEARLKSIFATIPFPTLEYEGRGLFEQFVAYRQAGITDLRAHLSSHPEQLRELVSRLAHLDENPASRSAFESTIGEHPSLLMAILEGGGSPLFREAFAVLFEGGTSHAGEVLLEDGQTRTRHLLLILAVIPHQERPFDRVLITLVDVTPQKQAEKEKAELERQLQKTHRIESLGTLAGGIAHEMNNVLGAILGLADTNLASHPEGSRTHRAFETIVKAASRGGQVVRKMLDISRQSPAELRELDINALVLEVEQLLERTTFASIQLSLDLAEALPHIQGDPSAITHAFMNLCLNAIDAMGGKGTLAIRTHLGLGGSIELDVEDSGCGMTQEVLDKAFDPFFTTKPEGKGTGLGLTLVQATVKSHGGTVRIKSEVGRGTTVTLAFPAQILHSAGPAVSGGDGTFEQAGLQILLVDDDVLIRSMMADLVTDLGHSVRLAASGEAALAELEAGYHPDLVLLDLNMPGLGGPKTLPLLRALRPAVPILVATGRVDQSALDLVASQPHVRLLPKPFKREDLQNQIRALVH